MTVAGIVLAGVVAIVITVGLGAPYTCGDSGRASRTDLWNGSAVGNSLGGEAIVDCEKPDNVVYCANNQ